MPIKIIEPLIPEILKNFIRSCSLIVTNPKQLRIRSYQYLRSKKILWDYKTHYKKSQKIYTREDNIIEPAIKSINDIGVQVLLPNASNNFIELPHNYLDLIDRIHNNVSPLFDETKNYDFYPKPDQEAIPELTKDVQAIKNKEITALFLKHRLDIDGLQELSSSIAKELEQKVYHSYILADKVYFYRNLANNQKPVVSWLWHYDNHPREIIKVMIYLTDVNEDTAPFEYLRSKSTLKPVHAPSLTPGYAYSDSRIPDDTIRQYLDNGFESYKVTGPRGTIIIFDNNYLHRATIPKINYRDVIVVQFRPATFKARPYINPEWTGSFDHNAYNMDPFNYTPVK